MVGGASVIVPKGTVFTRGLRISSQFFFLLQFQGPLIFRPVHGQCYGEVFFCLFCIRYVVRFVFMWFVPDGQNIISSPFLIYFVGYVFHTLFLFHIFRHFFLFLFLRQGIRPEIKKVKNSGDCTTVAIHPRQLHYFNNLSKKKKCINMSRALKILHEKSRIFEMRRIRFCKKNPQKKIFPPATSGRRALRARLPDSHRAERRVNFAR